MNKLSKEKRDHLILTGLGTVALLVVIGYFVILPQYANIREVESRTDIARQKLQSMVDEMKKQQAKDTEAHDVTSTLTQVESDIAFGDPIAWFYETLRNFKGRYKVDLSVTGQSPISDVDLLPNFPYKQLRVSVTGTAYYHDLGKFIADFENTFPHIRIVNLNLEPGDSGEKLNFRMDIIALVKTGGTQS